VSDPHETARDLLRHIGAPPATVNVLIRGATSKPHFIVWLSPSVRVHESRLPKRFGGFDVTYERRPQARPLKLGIA
jgi:hypothetical protein